MTQAPPDIDPARLAEFETLAAEFAHLAGAEIVAARGKALAVRYKELPGAAERAWRDPVTEVDHDVEVLIRARLSERFADHDVVGEEIETEPAETKRSDFLWAVDPIDGTANFVNGFPLYAASIGLLHRGRPVVGAVWCSATHLLGPGVYHARLGGALSLDGRRAERAAVEGLRRRIAGVPGDMTAAGPYDARWTGSAAIECAFVAAGLMAAARFKRPSVWDVAGGAALVLAAGGTVLEPRDGGWAPFQGFGRSGDPSRWSGSLVLAESDDAARALLR
jgi:myo-inositol-1(or 4)-monophosphatase